MCESLDSDMDRTSGTHSRVAVRPPRADDAPVAVIVDDSLTVRMDLAAAFEAAGFKAQPCATATEARAAWTRAAAVVVLAAVPDADGVALARELRASPATAAVPIVMLSSAAATPGGTGELQTAMVCIAQPYDRDEVVARARELIGARAAQPDERPTVLVIDDSPTFVEEVRRALDRAGYAVMTVASGEDGLRIAAAHRPAALIVDGQLPGMDGPTVIRRIRLDLALRSMPCLLLTGSDARGAELQALHAGADAFVRKEGELDVMLARLGAVLRRSCGAPDEVTPLLDPKRILVVDDSEIYLQAVAATLRSAGYEVVMATSGETALELLAAQPVDCVLLDRMMPGIGGMETCRRIKASSLREVPLIMITAADDRPAMMEGLAAGADDYILKTDDLALLNARVDAQIRRKQLDDDSHRRREALLRSELDAAEAHAARLAAEAQAAVAHELARQNRELEAFAYSVSHDLRSPLRSIDAFSLALLEDEAVTLGENGRGYLRQVRASAQRMRQLIDDLMLLSRIGRTELKRKPVSLSEIAHSVAAELERTTPERRVAFGVRAGLVADADAGLIRVLLENLLGNAWKFTAKRARACIDFGAIDSDDGLAFFIQDNGAGFDRAYASNLFTPFARLHSEKEFAGTGIGLATVHRIVERHGGRAWAEGAVGVGATIFFTLPGATAGR